MRSEVSPEQRRKFFAEDVLTALARYGEQSQRGLLKLVPGEDRVLVTVLRELVQAGRVVTRKGPRRSIVYDLAPIGDPDRPIGNVAACCAGWADDTYFGDGTGHTPECTGKAPRSTPDAVNGETPWLEPAQAPAALPGPSAELQETAAERAERWARRPDEMKADLGERRCVSLNGGAPCGRPVKPGGLWCDRCEQNVRRTLGLGG